MNNGESLAVPEPQLVFAHHLRCWRETTGLPLKRIAYDLGVSIAIVGEWERGNRFPCARHLQSLAHYCQIPVRCFFCDQPGATPVSCRGALGGACPASRPAAVIS
jgi:transcriptional regulator with XRE-family HTH domain